MKALWDHIDGCQQTFERFMANKWIDTQPFEMEDDVKKLMKILKDMKIIRKQMLMLESLMKSRSGSYSFL